MLLTTFEFLLTCGGDFDRRHFASECDSWAGTLGQAHLLKNNLKPVSKSNAIVFIFVSKLLKMNAKIGKVVCQMENKTKF